jgi:mRNA-degrading endonuclease toxin of MazEF toxin-antitoxin module
MSRVSVNNAGRTVVVVPMTTSGAPNAYYRIRVPAGEMVKDVSCNSTLVDSIAKCDHLAVIDKSLLENRIGKLTDTAVIAVQLGIAFVFDVR